MNTNRTPHTALVLTALTLSLGTVACGGGSASMSVEGGVVTEVHEVTADDLAHLRVTLRYPESRLLAGHVLHTAVRVTKLPDPGQRTDLHPRLHLPSRGKPAYANDRIDGGAARPARPEARDVPAEGSLLERLGRSGPRVEARPEWMQVELHGAEPGRYRVDLEGIRESHDDVIPGAARRQ